ncbi:hypothetical protein V1512DRAFT_266264 [Lipomyces arxii]|uniref:uncharacterized protein n=1 Tax=Lipomyces arxii TaxID=56418 RepID=UPI0034CDA9D2
MEHWLDPSDGGEPNPWTSVLPTLLLPQRSTETSFYIDTSFNRNDLLKCFPVEVIDKIINHISYPALLELKLLSKSWASYIRDRIQFNPKATFKHLDFSNWNDDLVSPEYMVSCIQRAGGSVEEISFQTCNPRQHFAYTRLAIILQHKVPAALDAINVKSVVLGTSVWGPDPISMIESVSNLLSNLQVLSIDDSFSCFLQEWNHFGSITLDIFAGLRELRISMGIMPDFIDFLGKDTTRIWFPNLEVFECRFDKNLDPMLNQKSWPDFSRPARMNTHFALPNVRRFMLGDVPQSRKVAYCPLDQQCLDLVICWMPCLDTFSCHGIAVVGTGSYSYLVPRSDFRQNKLLKTFDFSYSNALNMPAIPCSCEQLILRSSGLVPRTLAYIDGQEHYVGQLGIGNILDLGHSGPDLSFMDSTVMVTDEYGSLSVLDVSGSDERMTSEVLCGILARCNPLLIKELSFQFCPRISFTREFICGGKCRSNNVLGWILELCPMLEILRIGQNVNVVDDIMKQVVQLRKLHHLNIANTTVTDTGINYLCMAPQLKTVALHGSQASGRPLQAAGIDIVDEVLPILL